MFLHYNISQLHTAKHEKCGAEIYGKLIKTLFFQSNCFNAFHPQLNCVRFKLVGAAENLELISHNCFKLKVFKLIIRLNWRPLSTLYSIHAQMFRLPNDSETLCSPDKDRLFCRL